MICTVCGTVGEPKSITKGSILMELVLWMFFLLPGFIYSIWRLSSRHKGCPKCGGMMISEDSPFGLSMKVKA